MIRYNCLQSYYSIRKGKDNYEVRFLYRKSDISGCTQVFSNTDIKGGVAITYHDINSDFGAIGTFTPNDILNAVLKKVKTHPDYSSFSSVVITRTAYRLTDKMHEDYPNARYRENDKGENIGCLRNCHEIT